MKNLLEIMRQKLADWRAMREDGQATAEYAMVTAALLGGTALSWPFLIEMIDALQGYYESVYWTISAPLP